MTVRLLDQFLSACEALEPLRIVVEHASGAFERSFRQPYALVGRDANADIRIDDDRLNPRHAYLQLIAGRLLFVNFQSLAASRKRDVQYCGWLDPGHRHDFGALALRLAHGSPIPAWSQAGRSYPYKGNVLTEVNLDLSSRFEKTNWKMRRPLTLFGSSHGCKVRLRDSGISRFHCALVNTPYGLWVVDLLSRTGITVNDVRVRCAKLEAGDTLRLGSFTICARYERPVPEGQSGIAPEGTISTVALPSALPGGPVSLSVPGLPADLQVELPRPMASAPGGSVVSVRGRNVEPVESASNGPDFAVAASPPPVTTDVTGAALNQSNIVVQLAQMQQQMFLQVQAQMADQFQQAMRVFVETFWTMFDEHANLVRREMKRIRRLTVELSALKEQLAMGSPPRGFDALSAPAPLPSAPVANFAKEAANPVSAPAAIPGTSSKPKSLGARESAKKIAPPGGAIPDQSPSELHAWLHDRVNKIQKQRNSSWQRILKLMKGESQAKGPVTPGHSAQGTE